MIATANTHWSRMLAADDGLQPLASADILLLQEVINPDAALEECLNQAGFTLISIQSSCGLAIALRTNSGLTFMPHSVKTRQLQPMKRFERYAAQRWAKQSHQFTERGMLAAKFTTKGGSVLTLVNVHPSAPVQPLSRATQIKLIGQELTDPYYTDNLIVAGDMNHYRGPTVTDERMRQKAHLQRVDLHGEPTWYARGSKQEKYFKADAFFTRRPIAYYNGYHDAVLYRGKGLALTSVRVVDVQSDHRAIVARFGLSATG